MKINNVLTLVEVRNTITFRKPSALSPSARMFQTLKSEGLLNYVNNTAFGSPGEYFGLISVISTKKD